MPDDSVLIFNQRYLALKELGQGGFSRTYLAVDTHMPSRPKCVVKELTFESDNPELLELVQTRFQREAAILEVLGKLSTQIPSLYASSQEGSTLYLVQDWIDGETLQEKLDTKGALSENEVIDVLAGILPVLNIVHSKNVIHRDIKPDNLMLRNDDGKPVLIDFGAVKELISATAGMYDDSKRTIFIGTPAFAPMEQHLGKPVFASDLYSLGLTAICLLTGRPPTWKETDLATGRSLPKRFRPGSWYDFAPQVSPRLRVALDKAIQPAVEDRYQTAREMQSALRLRRSAVRTTAKLPLSGLDRLTVLAQEYNRIREKFDQLGTARRRELIIGVFNDMVKLSLEEESLDASSYLNSDDLGMRLAAYVYCYTYPRLQILPTLIGSVSDAGRQPFVQCRGLEAISRNLELHIHGEPEVVEGIKTLRLLLDNLDSDTLRHAELARILSRYGEMTRV